MKTINEYIFKNKKGFRVEFISDKDRKGTKIPAVDNLLFHWTYDGKTYKDGLYIRPDEALLIAKMLVDAVYKTSSAYKEGLLKKKDYYGYKEHKL